MKATEDCKYLGVVLDKRLKFHKHLRDMEKKATTRLSALQALTGSTWGISLEDMRNIYRSTILPLFLYCATVWYIGGFGYKTQQNQAIKTLKGVQKRAAQIIGGAFKTTAGAALDIELHLEPVDIVLEHHLTNAMLRTVANRTFDEITRIRLNTPSADPKLDARNPEFVQLSPLRKLEISYQAICGQSLSKLEKRCAYVQPPWWIPIAINIEESEGKEERATKTHDLIMGDPNNIIIFTDGSGIRNTQ